jgi:hypothetical protein
MAQIVEHSCNLVSEQITVLAAMSATILMPILSPRHTGNITAQ